MKFRLKEFLLNLNCYDYDRMTVTRLLICSLLVWQKNRMDDQRATVPPIEKVYIYWAQKVRCSSIYIAVYFNISLTACIPNIFFHQTSLLREIHVLKYVLKKYGTLYFVQYGIEVEYKMDIHILFSYITPWK